MKIYIYAFLILAAVLWAHLMGIHGLYYQYSTYDVFVHILGGIGIGLFITAFVKSNLKNEAKVANIRWKIILGVLMVGIVWELFEMYYNIASAPIGTKAYYIDTVKDLMDDIIGGGLVAWVCFRKQ